MNRISRYQKRIGKGENPYFEVHRALVDKQMVVREIEVKRVDRYDTRLVFWVLVHGEMDKDYAPFEFTWSGLTVAFLPEGETEKVLFETAFRQKTAIEKARVFLQNWLRHKCIIAELTEWDLAPRSEENRYFSVMPFYANQKMYVREVTTKVVGEETYLTFVVYANDGGYRGSDYRPYICRWDGKTVYFMMGGDPDHSRAIEPAATLAEATEKARVFLQNWLRHCAALATPPEEEESAS